MGRVTGDLQASINYISIQLIVRFVITFCNENNRLGLSDITGRRCEHKFRQDRSFSQDLSSRVCEV